jgi:hypothetical protein
MPLSGSVKFIPLERVRLLISQRKGSCLHEDHAVAAGIERELKCQALLLYSRNANFDRGCTKRVDRLLIVGSKLQNGKRIREPHFRNPGSLVVPTQGTISTNGSTLKSKQGHQLQPGGGENMRRSHRKGEGSALYI